MDVRAVGRTGVVSKDDPPPGALTWATVCELDNKHSGGLKAVTLVGDQLYTSGRKGIRRWSTVDGRSEAVIEAESFPTMVHALAVSSTDLWACMGDGQIALYDLTSRFPKRKPFRAHNGEIMCITEGLPGKTMITGGADFQVKVWTSSGELLSSSGHHHGAVECVLAVGELKHTVYTGSADGTVFLFNPDPSTGKLEEGTGSVLKAEQQAGVSCMIMVDGRLWCGCDNGEVIVWDGQRMSGRRKLHNGRVATMAKVGYQVWTGSADRQVCLVDAISLEVVCQIGDQGSFVKFIAGVGWSVWTVNNKGIRIFSSESQWRLASEELNKHQEEYANDLKRLEDSLRQAHQNTTARLQQEEQKYGSLLSEHNALNQRLASFQEAHVQASRAEQDNESLRIAAQQLQERHQQEIMGFQAKLEQINDAFQQKEQGYLQHLENERMKMHESMQETKKMQEESSNVRNMLNTELHQMRDELDRIKAEKMHAQSASQALQEELSKAHHLHEQEIAGLHQQLGALQQQIASESGVHANGRELMAQQIASLQQAVQAREEKCQNLEEQLGKTLSESMQVGKDHERQAKDLMDEKQKMEVSMKDMSIKFTELEKALADREAEIRKVQLERDDLESQNSNHTKSKAEWEEKRKEMERSQNEELQRVRDENSKIMQKVESIGAEKEDMEKSLNEMKDRMKTMKREQEQVSGTTSTLAQELSAAMKDKNDIESELGIVKSELQTAKMHDDALRTQLAAAQAEIVKLKDTVLQAQKDNIRFATELKEAQAQREITGKEANEDEAAQEPPAPTPEASEIVADLRRKLEELELEKTAAEGRTQEQAAELQNLQKERDSWRTTASKAVTDAADAKRSASREKQLEDEVERLQTRCRDADVRTAALLQDLHKFQQEIMAYQEKGQQSNAEVDEWKKAAEDAERELEATREDLLQRRSSFESHIQDLEARLKHTLSEGADSSRIKAQWEEDKVRWTSEVEERKRQLASCEQSIHALENQIRMYHSELSKQSGIVEELRNHNRRQKEDFETEAKKFEEALQQTAQEMGELRKENMQLQVELHSSRHRLAHSSPPEVNMQLKEAEMALRQANSDYHLLLQELVKIREEAEIKDHHIHQMAAEIQRLSQELEYYKSEHDRMDALIGVMENRSTQMRAASMQEGQPPTQREAQRTNGSEIRPNNDTRKNDRWIPPTGFAG